MDTMLGPYYEFFHSMDFFYPLKAGEKLQNHKVSKQNFLLFGSYESKFRKKNLYLTILDQNFSARVICPLKLPNFMYLAGLLQRAAGET